MASKFEDKIGYNSSCVRDINSLAPGLWQLL